MNAESQIHCDLGEWGLGMLAPDSSLQTKLPLRDTERWRLRRYSKISYFPHFVRRGTPLVSHWERPILLAVYVNVAWIVDNKAPLQFH